MSHTYAIVDLANMYSRARYVTRGDIGERVGMAMHITLMSIRKAWNDFNADHTVICLEGRSWRKDFYKPYKANREIARTALTPLEQEEDTLFWEGLNEIQTFLSERTNCTVLQNPILEADDLIAGWVQIHPNDKHVIISTDSDFVQLISSNVSQYNGITDILTTETGHFTNGKPARDRKGNEMEKPNPEWALFEKCIRGDKSDNVFSAYPGVRKKGTKNKVGLLDAFADKHTQGYNWNNLMLQRWTDHNGEERRVLDEYNRNVTLIDLTKQPEEIRACIDNTIKSVNHERVPQVGIHLMKFCAKWDLNTISDQAEQFSQMLSAAYEA